MSARGNLDYDQIRAAARQGNGTQFQMFGGGSVVTGAPLLYDANGNAISGAVAQLVPTLPADATKFLDGTGAWSVPAGGGGGGGGSPNFFGLWSFTAPPSTGWSWDNQGSSTIDSTNGYEYLYAPSVGAVKLSLRYRTAPSTPYNFDFLLLNDISFGKFSDISGGGEAGSFVGFRDGTGKLVTFLFQTSGGVAKYGTHKWTTSISYSAAYDASTNNAYAVYYPYRLLRIRDDGTNLYFYTSVDGNHWQEFDHKSRTDWFASGPTQICFGAYNNQTDIRVAVPHLLQS